MSISDLKRHYQELFRQHGVSHNSVQWSSRETQAKRFQHLVSLVSPKDSVLDVGCGFGDLASYLCEETGFQGRYLGVDFVDEFIQHGKQDVRAIISYQLLDAAQGDLPKNYDWVVASGIFNNELPDNWGQLKTILARMFAAADTGVSFNLLSTYVDYRSPGLCYYDPRDVFDYCKREFTPKVVLDHGYQVKPGVIPFEFTVHLLKN